MRKKDLNMIELIATAESLEQGKKLVDIGVKYIIVGEERYGLRIPGYFSFEEMTEMADYAHEHDSKVVVAANAILHNDKISTARDYLAQVKQTGADLLMAGDTGLIQILKEKDYQIPYFYDAAVLNTSAGQVNFWAKYGAVGAMVAREVPYVEMVEMAEEAAIPLIVQTYGASCIHQSGRMLLDNYFSYVGKDKEEVEDHELFLSQPGLDETHFSIFQDDHGTHVFADNDLNLMPYLNRLSEIGISLWYTDGIYCPGDAFVDINALFLEARDQIQAGTWNGEEAARLDEKLQELHPDNREVSSGFFLYDKDTVR